MQIIDIPESFVNFCNVSPYSDDQDGDCNETNAGCTQIVENQYPLYALPELAFQVLIYPNPATNEGDLILAGIKKFYIAISPDCNSCNPANIVAQLRVDPWKASGADRYDFFVGSIDGYSHADKLDSYTDGQCFYLCLLLYDNTGFPDTPYSLMGCSPAFRKITDTCFTSVITYRNNETSFGYYFTETVFSLTYFNSIRLPFKLGKPQPKTTKSVTRLSNGNWIKNSATKAMEWQGETEMISEKWHKKLDIALDHDELKITNENSGFVNSFFMSAEDNNYKIDWQEVPGDYPHAKATFALMQEPYNEFNNNCNLTPLNPITNINGLLSNSYNLLLWGV